MGSTFLLMLIWSKDRLIYFHLLAKHIRQIHSSPAANCFLKVIYSLASLLYFANCCWHDISMVIEFSMNEVCLPYFSAGWSNGSCLQIFTYFDINDMTEKSFWLFRFFFLGWPLPLWQDLCCVALKKNQITAVAEERQELLKVEDDYVRVRDGVH